MAIDDDAHRREDLADLEPRVERQTQDTTGDIGGMHDRRSDDILVLQFGGGPPRKDSDSSDGQK